MLVCVASVCHSPTGPDGNISFPLPYYRQDVQLRIISSISDDRAIASSNTITASVDERVQHVRLSIGPHPNSMLLTYTTRANVSSSVTLVPSSQPSASSTIAPFQSITYSASQMCGEPATNQSIGFRDPGFHHTVLLSNLSPSQLYNYTISLDSSPAAQRCGSFSGPVGPSRDTPVGLLLFGDMGVWLLYRSSPLYALSLSLIRPLHPPVLALNLSAPQDCRSRRIKIPNIR